MEPVDPRVPPSLVPQGSKAIVIGKFQGNYHDLPSVVTPTQYVITRWTFTAEERQAIAEGEDVYLTIRGTPIRPVFLTVGPCDWSR